MHSQYEALYLNFRILCVQKCFKVTRKVRKFTLKYNFFAFSVIFKIEFFRLYKGAYILPPTARNRKKINLMTFYCTCTYYRFVLCK